MDATAPAILELGAVLLVAAAAGWIARRLRLPAVVGYLAVGVALSPFTPGFVANREQLQLFADLGVVLLLFEVGIEVDIGRLRRDHAGLIWASPLQICLTTLIVAVAAGAAGLPPFGAAIVGLSVAMSSSVVVVNITRSRRRTTDRETEQALLGWSVLQDVTGVVIGVGVLAAFEVGDRPFGLTLISVLGFAIFAVIAAAVLPQLLRRLREFPDLFLIVSVASGLTVAAVGAVVAAIPLALAAFVAGLAITESSDAAEARRRLLPLRDLLAVLFFVAIGTLIDPGALGRGLGWLAFIIAGVVIAKVGPVYLLARVAGLAGRPGQLAIGLGQVGEFSFVLSSIAVAAGAISTEVFTAMLSAVVITIIGSTVAVRLIGQSRLTRGDPPSAPSANVA